MANNDPLSPDYRTGNYSADVIGKLVRNAGLTAMVRKRVVNVLSPGEMIPEWQMSRPLQDRHHVLSHDMEGPVIVQVLDQFRTHIQNGLTIAQGADFVVVNIQPIGRYPLTVVMIG